MLRTVLEYSMRPVTVVALAAAAVAAAFVAAVADGPTGRLFAGIAAALLAAEALRGALLRPALRATEDGLDLVVAFRREHVPWPDVEAVRADRQRRRLVSSTWLEVDTGDRLLALPSYRLGAPAAEVAAAVNARR